MQKNRSNPKLSPRETSPFRWERSVVLALCVVAALRVFVFSAAFPFFNNVDEEAHVDLVRKYAMGQPPTRSPDYFDLDSGRLFLLYGTPQYFTAVDRHPAGKPPRPYWSNRSALGRKQVEQGAKWWSRQENHEAQAPPVYYALAGAWYRLGGGLGLSGGKQLYWIRFLNVPLIALLVWVGYLYSRAAAAEHSELRLAVPFLLALAPQDVFYSVNSDVLSPVLFALAALLLWRWYLRDTPGHLFSTGVGLLVALCFLVKFTNVVIALILAAATILKATRLCTGNSPVRLVPVAIPAIASALPVLAFFARNLALYGDFTGTGEKVRTLGWSLQTAGGVADHPLFSLEGIWFFWNGLMTTFWRGEFVWYLERIASPAMDRFFAISSAVLLLVAAVELMRRRRGPARVQSELEALGWASVLLSVGCLATLSVLFEYGESYYPSPDHPFFTSGRLIAGMAVPFTYLYMRGLAALVRPWAGAVGVLVAVGVVGLAMSVSEITLTWPFFDSPFNYFNLP